MAELTGMVLKLVSQNFSLHLWRQSNEAWQGSKTMCTRDSFGNERQRPNCILNSAFNRANLCKLLLKQL